MNELNLGLVRILSGSVSTGCWFNDGWLWGEGCGGKYSITENRQIIIDYHDNSKNYRVNDAGHILDSKGIDTGYYFDELLFVWGPESKVPWAN